MVVGVARTCCGLSHTVCLDPFGCLWTFGSNELGQLGYGDQRLEKIPRELRTLPPLISVACGSYHTICCDDNGNVWTFGYNLKGQLGTGDTDIARFPRKLKRFAAVVSVHAGGSHSVCIDSLSSCWCFGDNTEYQLGLESGSEVVSVPRRIPDLSQVTDVACGPNFTICIKKYGSVICFGSNTYKQLGEGENLIQSPRTLPNLYGIIKAACGFNCTLFLDSKGSVFFCGQGSRIGEKQNISVPLIIPLPPVKYISAYLKGMVGIDDGGYVWEFGTGDYMQEAEIVKLPGLEEISGISSGLSNHVFYTTTASVWSHGSNTDGQLGFPDFLSRAKPSRLPEEISLIWRESRTRAKSANK